MTKRAMSRAGSYELVAPSRNRRDLLVEMGVKPAISLRRNEPPLRAH